MSGYFPRNRGAHHPYQNQGYHNRRIGHQGQGDQRQAPHRRFSFGNQELSTPAAELPVDRLEPRRRSSSPSAEQERSRKRHHDTSDFSDDSTSRSPSPGDSDSTIAQERRSSKRNGWLSKLAEIFGIEENTKKTNSKKREEMKKLGEEIEDITEEISRKEDDYMKRKEDLRQNKIEHFEKREEAKIYLRGLQAELYKVPGDRETFTFNVEQYQRNGKILQELHNDIEQWKVEEAAIEKIEAGVRALKGKLVEKERLQEEVGREMEALKYELDNLSEEIKSISRKIGKSCGRSHRKKTRRSVRTPSNGDSTLPIHEALLDHDYGVRHDVEKLHDPSSLTNTPLAASEEREKARAGSMETSEVAQTKLVNEKDAPEKSVAGRELREELGEPQNPSAPAAPQESSKNVTTVPKNGNQDTKPTRIQEEIRKEAPTSSAKSSEGTPLATQINKEVRQESPKESEGKVTETRKSAEGSHSSEKSRDVEMIVENQNNGAPPTEQEQGSDKTVTKSLTESAQKNQNEGPATSSAASGTSNALGNRENGRSTQSAPELAAKTQERRSEPKQNVNTVAPKTNAPPLLSPSEIKEEVVDEGETLASAPSTSPIARVVKEEAPSPSEAPEQNNVARKSSYKDQWEAPPSRASRDPNMQNEVAATKSPSNRSGVQADAQQRIVAPKVHQDGAHNNKEDRALLNMPTEARFEQEKIGNLPGDAPTSSGPSSLPPPVPQFSSATRENQKKHNLETIVNGLADKVVEDTANQPSTSGTASPRFSWGRTPRGRKLAAAQQGGPQLRSRRK
ncbi:hypothetical protein CAEBREN_22266 [Caenorhabditis brenneri]|uniref:Uncharacterized protein n=1 Tax=Caenorhabditis brenneri TaxID=135651 RepID=G0MCP8_CAEBE|nr:hypothetical protein CAEBREN_22266 [Caenorhabditis brenneri]